MMYIDENCFLPLKMREGYPIEANFLVLVPNRGFTPFFWVVISVFHDLSLFYVSPGAGGAPGDNVMNFFPVFPCFSIHIINP